MGSSMLHKVWYVISNFMQGKKMDSKDISVVIQGPIYIGRNNGSIETEYVCRSIRELLPYSEIILSTYEGSIAPDADVDKVVFSADPGAIPFEEGSDKPNNLNRMLVTSQAGIREVSRKFTLKIRSDMAVQHGKFIDHWERLAIAPHQFGIFEKQVIAYPIYSLRFEGKKKIMPKPFHVSDWCFFGLSEDVRFLFDIPLVEEPLYSNYFRTHKSISYDTLPAVKWKYSPEQYLFYSAFSKKHHVKFENKQDYSKENIKVSEEAVFNNFIFIDPDMWGLSNTKQFYAKKLYRYDNNCYYGLIQFGTYMSMRRKLGMPVHLSDAINGYIRKFWNDARHEILFNFKIKKRK
ncbi:WavE lipopolysaccharide synthesis [Acetobacter orientalis]|uniref:WavE lipopolysaccharide synthesis n=1 Tax=Acetobacter orientalis TaxID=146474 RepID=A0A2Z5ZLT9_9PROT|nr:WavE lipopolysaccharide synthesis [Acetobacter orientalis]